MIREISEKFNLRPSDLLDTNDELYDNEKIHLDYLVAIARSEEGSKTMSGEELESHLRRAEEITKKKMKGGEM